MASRGDWPLTSATLDVPENGQSISGLLVSLTAALGTLHETMEKAAGPKLVKPQIPWDACHPVPIINSITLSSGAGTLDQPDLLGPHDPYWWDLRMISVWGFTAGKVVLSLNDNAGNGVQLGTANSPGEFTWSTQRLLGPRDRIVFVASGITGNVQIWGEAIEVKTDWLPTYLV